MKTSKVLEKLVSSGEIKSYRFDRFDEMGRIREDDTIRGSNNTERLTVVLPSGSTFIVDCYSSGVLENLTLVVDEPVPSKETD